MKTITSVLAEDLSISKIRNLRGSKFARALLIGLLLLAFSGTTTSGEFLYGQFKAISRACQPDDLADLNIDRKWFSWGECKHSYQLLKATNNVLVIKTEPTGTCIGSEIIKIEREDSPFFGVIYGVSRYRNQERLSEGLYELYCAFERVH